MIYLLTCTILVVKGDPLSKIFEHESRHQFATVVLFRKTKTWCKRGWECLSFLFGFQTCVDWCLKQLPCQLVLEATVPEPLHFRMKYSWHLTKITWTWLNNTEVTVWCNGSLKCRELGIQICPSETKKLNSPCWSHPNLVDDLVKWFIITVHKRSSEHQRWTQCDQILRIFGLWATF